MVGKSLPPNYTKSLFCIIPYAASRSHAPDRRGGSLRSPCAKRSLLPAAAAKRSPTASIQNNRCCSTRWEDSQTCFRFIFMTLHYKCSVFFVFLCPSRREHIDKPPSRVKNFAAQTFCHYVRCAPLTTPRRCAYRLQDVIARGRLRPLLNLGAKGGQQPQQITHRAGGAKIGGMQLDSKRSRTTDRLAYCKRAYSHRSDRMHKVHRNRHKAIV